MSANDTPLAGHRRAISLTAALALAAALAIAVTLVTSSDEAGAKHNDNHVPANKVAVSGSDIEILGPQQSLGQDRSIEKTLLSTTMRNAAAKSLTLQVTLECSILTDLETDGTDESEAESTLEVWIERNGERVSVAGDDDGEVTFCNRQYQRSTNFHGDDEDHIIDDHIATKQAHGFNWMSLRPGNGIQTIEVKGRLTTDSTMNADATVTVGKRTLIVEPVQAGPHEDLDN